MAKGNGRNMEDKKLIKLAKSQVDYWHEAAHKINDADKASDYWKKPSHKSGYTDGMLSLVMVRLGEVERKLDALLVACVRIAGEREKGARHGDKNSK